MRKKTPDGGLISLLSGGDLRSIGRADEVARKVLADPSLFEEIFDGLTNDDPVIRARSADAVEKITKVRPGLLAPHKKRLLGEITAIDQQEVRWHVAQMIPRLSLSSRELKAAVKILSGWADSEKSGIVKTFSLQALADLSRNDVALKIAVTKKLQEALKKGTPAMIARARKLLKGIGR